MSELLVLHAVRLKGFADVEVIAGRFGLDRAETGEQLLDAEAYGLVSRSEFAGLAGWSLTERGRARNEALLSEELDRAGARSTVAAVHDRFLPLNAEASRAFTAWQLETDRSTDTFLRLAGELRALEGELAPRLDRFGGYHARFDAALRNAARDPAWITGINVDSCHKVWFELHEDLIATLGITRA
ncbi:transcriptional regulator [Dactylosporangium sp. NPDC051541]|uniref:transcriptional regulator n=1 Tax=Dactylosporangium sp. NPDC051541 TaxID=3363977 RepID=UPI00379EF63C